MFRIEAPGVRLGGGQRAHDVPADLRALARSIREPEDAELGFEAHDNAGYHDHVPVTF